MSKLSPSNYLLAKPASAKPVSIKRPLASRLCRFLIQTSLFIPTAVFAASPIGFDGWSVNQGVIDTSNSCTNGISCNTIAEDDGFLYQEVITAQGTFYRTIITESGATGNAGTLGFADESFVPVNNLSGTDISDKQVVRDSANGFDSTTMIDRDPFINGAGDMVNPLIVDINQSLMSDGLSSEFHLLQNDAVVGDNSYFGKTMDISQSIVMPTDTASDGFQSGFDLRERDGWQISEVNNELALDPFSPAGSMTLGNKTVSWDDGDRIRSTWIASVNKDVSNQGFAVQKIENLTQMTSAQQIDTNAGTVIDPFVWEQNTFGTAPSLPAAPSASPPP